MDKTAKLRKTTWYGNFKWLAEGIKDKSPADVLRAFHKFLDVNNKYGSMTIAASAERSLEQVIKDFQLEGNTGIATRWENTTAEAYGNHITVKELLEALTDKEIAEVFSGIYESILQEGRLDRQLPEKICQDSTIAV